MVLLREGAKLSSPPSSEGPPILCKEHGHKDKLP